SERALVHLVTPAVGEHLAADVRSRALGAARSGFAPGLCRRASRFAFGLAAPARVAAPGRTALAPARSESAGRLTGVVPCSSIRISREPRCCRRRSACPTTTARGKRRATAPARTPPPLAATSSSRGYWRQRLQPEGTLDAPVSIVAEVLNRSEALGHY